MSPKSRGRPHGRGRPRRPATRGARPLGPAEQLLQEARRLPHNAETLELEVWASGWLGRTWLGAAIGQRDAEAQLCGEVAERAARNPSSSAALAVACLARVAPAEARESLQHSLADLRRATVLPGPVTESSWTATAGHRGVDVWQSERVLFVDFDGPEPHTLMASILDVGGTVVDRLEILVPGALAAWEEAQDPEDPPMPLEQLPADDVLAELVDALHDTDITLPRMDDERFVELRALAWSRCRDHLPEMPEWEDLSDEARDRWIGAFVTSSGLPDDDVTHSLADLFLDYGSGYLHGGPLSWSPGSVMLFLTDFLPRKVALDAAQRAALPEALRRWVRFALTERGVDPRWIEPVVDEVDRSLPEFQAAFDDSAEWGPATSMVSDLTERGVDLDDRAAVEEAIRQVNAEGLARRLFDES